MGELKNGSTVGGHKIWHSGNDGEGSGLHADKLDNYDLADIQSEIDGDISTHAGVADAHHAKYTDAEAILAINGDLDHGSTASHNYRTDEEIEDIVNGLVVGGTNVTVDYDDENGTLTINSTDTDTQLTDEQVQDIVGAFVVAGTNVTVDYDDSANTLTISSSDTNTQNTIDTSPVSGNTDHSISSDWAYDHENNAVAHHNNLNDPTPDEKAAMTNANTPSSSNPFATMDDVGTLQSMMPVGIKWDTASSSPSLTHIDINGNEINPDTSFFDNHVIWGNIWRCVVDPDTGEVTYGDNARGDGLDLTGASGNVMVSIPRFHAKFYADDRYRIYWLSPTQLAGFEEFPSHVQRGGVSKDRIFVSAYEASGILDTTFKLQSATGKTPVTGGVAYPDLPNSGRFTIDDAELYANNIGSGYGCMNIWTMSAIRLLFYTEMGSLDSQTALGRGVVDLDAGTGFAGLNTGADSADTNIGTNGTGTGTGTDGETPVVYRGIENMWGNVWQFCIGYNAVDAEYRITPRDGTGALAGDLAAGEYEASVVEPILSDGYQSDVETENLLKYLLIGSETAGSSSTYLCDYFHAHDAGEQNVMLSGGSWNHGSYAGVGSLSSNNGSSFLLRSVGARFEFIPQ
jgi:hypothetical protein